MARQEIVLRVFVAFPDDVNEEVAAVDACVEELNSTLPRHLGRRLEMITWRNATVPGVGTDPQAVINDQIGENYDIFIGILWGRFGTPTPRAGSGAEEEFERALARHNASPGSVRVMVYFKKAPIEVDQIAPAHIQAIKAFRTKLGPKGVLYWDFNSREEFESFLRIHLSRQVTDWGKTWGTGSSGAQNDPPQAPRMPRGCETDEEGMLDLIERGTEGLQIANEATERIRKLQEQMTVRTQEKVAQLADLSNLPEHARSKIAKQVFNSAAVDLEQFAKGLSSETAVLSEHLLSGIEAFSKFFTYTEFHRPQDADSRTSLGDTLRQASENLESFRRVMIDLRETIQKLPRFTTHFNRAKRVAAAAIDEFDRFATGGSEVLVELRRNFDALVSFLGQSTGNPQA